MNASRLFYLLLMLVTGWCGASAVQATDPASPIGFWKGQDGTFEMFESEGKLSARIVALNEPKTAEGKKDRYLQSGSEETQPSDRRACLHIWLYEEK
jgi:hypothetical protein